MKIVSQGYGPCDQCGITTDLYGPAHHLPAYCEVCLAHADVRVRFLTILLWIAIAAGGALALRLFLESQGYL